MLNQKYCEGDCIVWVNHFPSSFKQKLLNNNITYKNKKAYNCQLCAFFALKRRHSVASLSFFRRHGSDVSTLLFVNFCFDFAVENHEAV